MICNVAMNVMQNLNLFLAKGGVPSHYIPHIILSHRNWDYSIHCQVGLCVYVYASQVNYPKNTNFLRTLDGTYLCPAPNLQGWHQNMNLRMGKLITRPKAVEITITTVVTNPVEKMAQDQVFKPIKFYNWKKKSIIFLDVDFSGVDHHQILNKLNKTKMRNMNMIPTTQNIFMMRRFLMTKILIMKTYMG